MEGQLSLLDARIENDFKPMSSFPFLGESYSLHSTEND